MKKVTILLMVIVCSFLMLFKPSPSKAADVKLGVEMMYDWWNPVFRNFHNGEARRFPAFKMDDEYDGSFMLGPTLWAKISGKWALGFTFLAGVTKNEISYTSFKFDMTMWPFIPGVGGSVFPTYFEISTTEVRRFDVDLDFERVIHKLFYLHIGLRFKYGDGDGDFIRLWGFNYGTREFNVWQLGPSLGIGFRYTIKGFTIGARFSLLAHFGNYELEKRVLSPIASFLMPYEYDVDFISIGLDNNIRLAYFIKPAHIEVFTGFRYIVGLHIDVNDDASVMDLNYSDGWMSGEADHFYGIKFGVLYKF